MSEPTLPKAGRPSKKDLDERAEGLSMREKELEERERHLAESETAALDAAARENKDPSASEPLPQRQSIDEVVQRKDGDNSKSVRREMGRQKRLDADIYLEIHQDKKLMWVNDIGGEVERWIDMGAEPVRVASRSGRTFEGITDRTESKWARAIGGDDGMGSYYWVYLLMIDPDLYDEIQLSPQRERQEMIRNAIFANVDRSTDAGGQTVPGPKLPTYQPNLPSGQTGAEITRETVR